MIIRRAWVRATVGVALAIAVLAAVAAAVLWGVLRASLPRTTGRIAVLGPTREVSIERDSLGIPVITGSSREDVAFATGFVHAQERFFQMDLMRRAAAGERPTDGFDSACSDDTLERVKRIPALQQEFADRPVVAP